MDKLLENKLEQFEQDEDWSGMTPSELALVTAYTLKALYDYLDEIGAPNESSVIGSALDLVETHLQED